MKRFIKQLSYFFSWLCYRGDKFPKRIVLNVVLNIRIIILVLIVASLYHLLVERWLISESFQLAVTAFAIGFVLSSVVREWHDSHFRGMLSGFLLSFYRALTIFINEFLLILLIYLQRKLSAEDVPKDQSRNTERISIAILLVFIVVLLFLPQLTTQDREQSITMLKYYLTIWEIIKLVI